MYVHEACICILALQAGELRAEVRRLRAEAAESARALAGKEKEAEQAQVRRCPHFSFTALAFNGRGA